MFREKRLLTNMRSMRKGNYEKGQVFKKRPKFRFLKPKRSDI